MSLLQTQKKRQAELIPTPQTPSKPAYFDPGSIRDEKSFPIKASTLIVITLILIVVIVVITFILIRRMTRETVETVFEEDIINLDALVDLEPDGLCCVTPSNPLPNSRWVYSPSEDFSFSIDKTTPSIACQGLIEPQLSECLAFVSNSDGSAKIVAHKGIVGYYGFSSGDAGGVCSSYAPC